MVDVTASSSDSGPMTYENWQHFRAGLQSRGAMEIPFYADAKITGELAEGLGPYMLLNTVPAEEGYGFLRPAVVLRFESHHPPDTFTSMQRTDTRRYHGGSLADEVAALVSLSLGVRCKAGPASRRFDTHGDPRGRPIAYEAEPTPSLVTNVGDLMLPWAIGPHSLDEARMLSTLPSLSPREANTFVKAARAYQNAVWVAEAEPGTAWLFLVSAIEAAAAHWSHARESPEEAFRRFQPELDEDLRRAGDDALVRRAAKALVRLMGAKSKFLQFVLQFCQILPARRPPDEYQFTWSPDNLRQALSLIYDYRSRALHGETPFPAPMCLAPGWARDWPAPWEEPAGLASSMEVGHDARGSATQHENSSHGGSNDLQRGKRGRISLVLIARMEV